MADPDAIDPVILAAFDEAAGAGESAAAASGAALARAAEAAAAAGAGFNEQVLAIVAATRVLVEAVTAGANVAYDEAVARGSGAGDE